MEDAATSAVGHERASAVLEVVEVLLPKPHVLPDAGDAARVLEGAADAAQRPHRSRPSSHQLLGRSQRIRGPIEAVAAVLSILEAFVLNGRGYEFLARLSPACKSITLLPWLLEMISGCT
jgi:hypothetical protein